MPGIGTQWRRGIDGCRPQRQAKQEQSERAWSEETARNVTQVGLTQSGKRGIVSINAMRRRVSIGIGWKSHALTYWRKASSVAYFLRKRT
ncbi:hypothetical protein SBA5_210005 [Candidatus Sulfotelmatomonas gaucii]|uniref:Uncharacterized protein n=1 Tax=Candidatus Sulfuritelmatomonas gaucii TaxID=2043161 RepID=A0A2N9L7B9_9BACT|nr:hypothetical protein SBA5_210005 [Candidatus Sulfotelmatomonas gaucii]